jgi:RNA exonuclease 4
VVALDCEMVGVGPFGARSALASVCVVNDAGNRIYFSYAKPPRKVTDYRTWVSGITPEHLERAPASSTVQEEVRALVAGRVVVGHSLENDFRALGFSPPDRMLRDTAHDLPRLRTRAGRPKKLRRLAWEFLGLTIQSGEHDPAEDAMAALFLYHRFRRDFEARAAQKAAEAEAREQTAGRPKVE